MGVYTRFKRNADGLRQLVELLEVTPGSRRQKMIDVGMQEDAAYTQKALQYVMTFEDILKLPDMELAEVLSQAPPRFTAYAIHAASEEIKNRFLSKCQPKIGAEIKECLEIPNVTPVQIGGGQMKMIEITRKLEKRGLVKTKRVPSE
jgi:flagellar motor switch protein FliG